MIRQHDDHDCLRYFGRRKQRHHHRLHESHPLPARTGAHRARGLRRSGQGRQRVLLRRAGAEPLSAQPDRGAQWRDAAARRPLPARGCDPRLRRRAHDVRAAAVAHGGEDCQGVQQAHHLQLPLPGRKRDGALPVQGPRCDQPRRLPRLLSDGLSVFGHHPLPHAIHPRYV